MAMKAETSKTLSQQEQLKYLPSIAESTSSLPTTSKSVNDISPSLPSLNEINKKNEVEKATKKKKINIFSKLLNGTSNSPVINEHTKDEPTTDENGRQLVRRSSLICSGFNEKYTFDSENVEIPYRSIDVYEQQHQQMKITEQQTDRFSMLSSKYSSSTNIDSNVNIANPRPRRYQRTESRLSSSTFASDRSNSMARSFDSNESSNSAASSPSTSVLTYKRDSVVQSAKFSLPKAIEINGRFQNPWNTLSPIRFVNLIKFAFNKDYSNIPNKEQLDITLPIVKPYFPIHPPDDGLLLTWLGHSTVLVQMDGVTFITDPIFSERASPVQAVGPKRYRDAPCSIHDLPSSLEAVVISHNHYDHLDLNTVILLNARYGADLRWFVPVGLGSWFEDLKCANVVELDWWEENCIPDKSDISFILTPAQHWSKRTPTDDNKSLWGSWTIIGPKHRFFFAGDTGYCSVFKNIGDLYGPFTAAAIPIGAFEPRWFMKYQHLNPAEAVQVHTDIRSKFSLGIHWGTFALANEYYLDPVVKLREAVEQQGIQNEAFVHFKHGETRLVKANGSWERAERKTIRGNKT